MIDSILDLFLAHPFPSLAVAFILLLLLGTDPSIGMSEEERERIRIDYRRPK